MHKRSSKRTSSIVRLRCAFKHETQYGADCPLPGPEDGLRFFKDVLQLQEAAALGEKFGVVEPIKPRLRRSVQMRLIGYQLRDDQAEFAEQSPPKRRDPRR